MILSGCAGLSPNAKLSPQETIAAQKPAGECGRVSARPVAEPKMVDGDDATAVIVRYRAALRRANRQGTEASQCADSAAARAGRAR